MATAKIFAVLALVTLGVSSAAALSTLGVAVSVAANTQTTIAYTTGQSLTIELNQAADVTLSAYVSASVSLPEGYSALSLAGKVGLQLAVSGGAQITAASVTTASLDATAVAAVTGSASAGCLRLDGSANAYTAVTATAYSAVTKKVTVTLPTTGIYVFAGVQQNVPLPTLYAEARVTVANRRSNYSYPGGLVLELTTMTDNKITVTKSSNSGNKPTYSGSVGVYFGFSLESEEEVEATMKYKYAASTTMEAANRLRWAFYNTTMRAWTTLYSGVNVDTSARIVAQTTAHFSDWTVGSSDSTFDAGMQAVTFTNPSKCYKLDWQRSIGVMRATLTKVSSNGKLRLYVRQGGDCPSASTYDQRTELIEDGNSKKFLEVTGDTDPALRKGLYTLLVRAEGLAVGGEIKYRLEVSNPLVPNGVATTTPKFALTLLSAFVALLWGRTLF